MSDFTNHNKSGLDDFFAEARLNGNITPAENLLKSGTAPNFFKSNFLKAGFAGLAAVGVMSVFLVKNDDASKPPVKNTIVNEISQEKPVKSTIVNIPKPAPAKVVKEIPFKKEIIPVENLPEIVEYRELKIAPENIRLNAIPLVELRDFELKDLGIVVLNNGDLQLTQAFQNGKVHFTHRVTQRLMTPEDEAEMHSLALTASRNVTPEEQVRVNPPTFSPKRVTDLSGTRTYFVEGGTEEYDQTGKSKDDNSEIPPDLLDYFQYGSQRTLTPALKVKLQEWALKQSRKQDSIEKTRKYIPVKAGNFIAWFRTNEEVLKRLPDFVCNTIHAELTGQDYIIQAEDFREEYPVSGYCYLDLCEKTNGAVVCSKVFPNPAVGKQTNLIFELSEERQVMIALYDLSGHKLREFCALKTLAAGRHEETIALDGVEKGIYLIAVVTDKGEKLSRRIILD